jgi:hypothetical protein
MGCNVEVCNELGQDTGQQRGFVGILMNDRVPLETWNFLTNSTDINISKTTQSREILSDYPVLIPFLTDMIISCISYILNNTYITVIYFSKQYDNDGHGSTKDNWTVQ